LTAFSRLCPQAAPNVVRQWQQGVEVCQWSALWQEQAPADVVIEAFACQLPGSYVAAMAARPVKVLWLNLEYLSAESWVGHCHGLPSLQASGVQKFFFFPGFTARTGGLLREAGLLEKRQCFQQEPQARERFLQSLGVKPEMTARLISLF